MKNGLYKLEVITTYTAAPTSEGEPRMAMVYDNQGLAFVKLTPTLPAEGGAVATLDGWLFSANDKGEVSGLITHLPNEEGLKEQERIFFALCYNLRKTCKPRNVVSLLADTIPHKRCWYYLAKWSQLGFYSYGVSLDLGWFYIDQIPPRYLEIIQEEAKK